MEKTKRKWPRPEPGRFGPWGFLAVLAILAGLPLVFAGCTGPDSQDGDKVGLTYVYDQQTGTILNKLASGTGDQALKSLGSRFAGITIPDAEWEREPYVLALATRSRVPAILFLDAPWVKRYGHAGWLEDLAQGDPVLNDVFRQIPPSLLAAFSLEGPVAGQEKKRVNPHPTAASLMAVPNFVKGNVLFFRKDLLKKYCGSVAGPETWDQLIDLAEKVMAGQAAEKVSNPIEYGLLFHLVNPHNDFYPILWGFGAEVFTGDKVLLSACLPQAQAALDMVIKLIYPPPGSPRLGPGPEDFSRLQESQALRKTFFNGQALFMINWNTRLEDLEKMILDTINEPGDDFNHLTDLDNQVGWCAIPRDTGHDKKYVNIGSFGWGLNQQALGTSSQRNAAYAFLRVVTSLDFQRMAALEFGQAPSRMDVVEGLKKSGEAPNVVLMYELVFNHPDVVLKARPYRRDINNIMDEYLMKALTGELDAAAAMKGAAADMERTLDQTN